MDLFICLATGTFFGAALYLSDAASPVRMRQMLRLEDYTIFKIILFAIGLSNVLLFVFNMAGILNLSHLSVKTMHLGVIIGGLIFGVGFGMVGSCPGTSFAAIGTNVYKQALMIAVGGIIGALVFSFMYKGFVDMGIFKAMNFGKLTLFKISEKYPSVTEIGYSGLLVMGMIFMAAAWFMPDKRRD
ncbi:MAG: YeeE/YedE thiosulfate transporter family protein [Synergistaceae bacterium]|nr:YeeE/YedE thiosulfate transporter family protein [Synergistaceae bacterium]